MLDLIGDAGAYLSTPAERSRWQDTWTMKRTRREAMTALGRGYASWLRTVCGLVSMVVLLGGAFLLGRGMTAVSADGGPVAVLTTVGAVLLLLVGLAAAGYVLFTGVQVVGALRAWSGARAQDGGPGVGAVLTPAVVVRLVLALVVFAAGVTLVLVRTGLLTIDLDLLGAEGEAASGQVLWQWFAAVIAIAGGLAAASGAIRAGLAVRRRPGKPAAAKQPAAEQQAYAPQAGYAQAGGYAPHAGYGQAGGYAPEGGYVAQAGYAPEAGYAQEGGYAAQAASATAGDQAAEYAPQTDDTWQAGYAPHPAQAPPAGQDAHGGYASGTGYAPQADDTWQAGYAPQTAPDAQAEHQQQADPAQAHPPVPSPYAPQSPYAPAAEPVPAAPEPEEEWAATRKVSDLPSVPAPPAARPALRAVLADGRTIAGDGVTLLGRSPAARTGEQIAESLAVADSGVSKTHLAVRMDAGQAWATDRASTNGTILVRDGGQEPLAPWQEVPLAAGDRVLLGSTTLQIEPVE